MNYYRRYPGDYARDTGHLSLAEHGAYALLLDYLYGTQRVLPGLELGLFRICKAHSPEEQQAVMSVIGQFFEKTPDGYTHKRVEVEIKKAESRINAARENGKKGGRPVVTQTPQEPSGFQSANPQESSPSTNNHNKKTKTPRAQRERPIPDSRFTPTKDFIERCCKHAKVPFVWDAAEAAQLSRWLKGVPGLDQDAIKTLVQNRFRSAEPPGRRPCEWIPHLSSYATGPLDRFNKPEELKHEPQKGNCDLHPNSGLTPSGSCWGCYSGKTASA